MAATEVNAITATPTIFHSCVLRDVLWPSCVVEIKVDIGSLVADVTVNGPSWLDDRGVTDGKGGTVPMIKLVVVAF
jgi:hypothetical protein